MGDAADAREPRRTFIVPAIKPFDHYDFSRAKVACNLAWLVAKAFGTGRTPAGARARAQTPGPSRKPGAPGRPAGLWPGAWSSDRESGFFGVCECVSVCKRAIPPCFDLEWS